MSGPEPLTVIQRHWDKTPVPVEEIIADMGIEYVREVLDENMSGFIERKPNGEYRIVVNARHPDTRQRFTAAHELGHYIYHRDLLGNGVGDNMAFRAKGTDRPNPYIGPLHERQANSFAANILMPKHVLTKYAGVPTAELANRFRVSAEAMRIRLGR